jgi:hypothetical protein
VYMHAAPDPCSPMHVHGIMVFYSNMYLYIHAQVMSQVAAQGGGGFSSSKGSSDEWFYDTLGWGILIIGQHCFRLAVCFLVHMDAA